MTSPLSVSSTVADWARFYAKAGFRSFPVWAGEKRPMFSGWPKDATLDPDQIDRYFRSEPNIGIVCGEAFDAWDIEVEHVPAFMEFVAKQEPQTKCPFGDPHGALPEAPIAQTGRGGIHILTAPTGVNGTRYLYLNGTHIGELKSTGGYILVCPSETEQMYRWTWLPDNLAVQPAPDWLKALSERPERPQKPTQVRLRRSVSLRPTVDILPLVAAVRGAGEHDRNGTLHWAANRAYDDGISQKIALDSLLPPFMAIALPGESPYERNIEGRATIASAYNHE